MQNNELKQYINLSNHLSEKLQNEPYINESLISGISGLIPKATKKQYKAVKDMLSSIGGFWSKLISGSGDAEKDPIAEEMDRQEEEAEKADKEREKKWAESEAALEVARLQAQFERDQNQKKLAFERRKRAVDAQAAKLAKAARSWKTNKIEYTLEELNGFAEEERKAYNQVAPLIANTELNELNELMYICYDEDANPLTLTQLKEKANNNAEFKKQFNRFKALIKKHKGVIIDSMQDEQFRKTVLKNVQTHKLALDAATTDVDNAETELNNFNIIANKVAEYKEEIQKHDDAKTKVESLETKINTFKDEGKQGELEIYTVDNGGNVTVKADRNTLASVYGVESLGQKDGNFDKTTYLAALRAKGIPDAVITKIEGKIDADRTFTPARLPDILKEAIDDNDMDSIKESMKNKLQGEYADLASQLESATQEKEALGQRPKPEDMEVTITENGVDKTLRLSEIDMTGWDTTTGIGQKNKKEAEDALEEAKNNLAEVERSKEVTKLRRKEAMGRLKSRNETQTPQEFRNAVDEINQGLQPGEEVRTMTIDGVVKEVTGFVVPGTDPEEFKRNPGRKSDKYNEYIENRNAALLKMTPKEPNRITKDDNGNYYINDKKVEGTEEEIKKQVAKAYAQNERQAETATEILAVKSKAAAKVAACIKDGKFDREKFDSLKPDEQALVRAVVNMTEEERKTVFKDVDLYGTEKTLSSIKKAIGGADSEAKIKDELDAEIKPEDFDNNTEFVGTPDKDGKKVKYIKGDDGKFYKVVGEDTDEKKTEMTFNEWIDAVEHDKEASKAMGGELELDTTLADNDYHTDHDNEANDDKVDATTNNIKIRTNPRKIWKRYTYKRGNKTKVSKRTYVNKDGDRISRSVFLDRCKSYDRFKAKHPDRVNDSLIYINLGNHLFESIGNTTNKYSKLRDCILNKLNS